MRNSTTLCALGRVISIRAFSLALLAGAGSARAATHLVSNHNDNGPGSLRQAIAGAAAGDTITFGITGTVILTSGALTITRDLSIQGPGPNKLAVSGNQTSRVFVIQGGTVSLTGITVTGGLANINSPVIRSVGGGILNYGSLTLTDVVVSGNAAVGDASGGPFGRAGWAIAGGIASFGTLHATDSQFTGNVARGGDGSSGISVGVAVGGAFGNWGPATLTKTQFIANRARGGDGGRGTSHSGEAYGGAIGNAAVLAIISSKFSHNHAIGGNDNPGHGGGVGGAIGSGGEGAPGIALIVRDSSFDHNQSIGGDTSGSGSSGGAINVWHGEGTISGCTFEHNDAIAGTGGSGVKGGLARGGAIFAGNSGAGSNVTVTNSRIEHNSARGGKGGSGANGGNGWGGGLFNYPGATLTLLATTVSYNLALGGPAVAGGSAGEGSGGGVYHMGPFSFDAASVILKNQASSSNDNLAP